MNKEPIQEKPTKEQLLKYIEYARAMQAKATETLNYKDMEYWGQELHWLNEELRAYGDEPSFTTPNNVIRFPIERVR